MKKGMEKKISELEEELKSTEERLKRIEEYEREGYFYYQPFKDPRTENGPLLFHPIMKRRGS